MPRVLLDTTAFIDIERAVKHRRKDWAAKTIANSFAYRAEHGRPFLSIVSVVEILQGLHKDIANPEKAERFTVSAPISFQFLEVTAEIAYLASKIIADLELKRQAIGFPDSLIDSPRTDPRHREHPPLPPRGRSRLFARPPELAKHRLTISLPEIFRVTVPPY